MPDYDFLLYGVLGPRVQHPRFNRPEKRNALTHATPGGARRRSGRRGRAMMRSASCCSRGAGTARFSAGLRPCATTPTPCLPAGQERWRPERRRPPPCARVSNRYLRIWYYPKPTVAQVQGAGARTRAATSRCSATSPSRRRHGHLRSPGAARRRRHQPAAVGVDAGHAPGQVLADDRAADHRQGGAEDRPRHPRLPGRGSLRGRSPGCAPTLSRQNPLGAQWLKDAINADYDMMGLRAAYPMHYSMNTAGRLTERGSDELSLRDIVFRPATARRSPRASRRGSRRRSLAPSSGLTVAVTP